MDFKDKDACSPWICTLLQVCNWQLLFLLVEQLAVKWQRYFQLVEEDILTFLFLGKCTFVAKYSFFLATFINL